MNKILYINGSPRGENNSTSAQILKDIRGFLSEEDGKIQHTDILTLPVKLDGNTEEVLSQMEDSDIWIIALPLYVDTLPGHLTWWLKQFELKRESRKEKKAIRVYGIVNSGFPEARQNADALHILQLFCRKNALTWRFGIGMGMGEPYKQMKDMPLNSYMKKDILHAYQSLKDDLKNEEAPETENLYTAVRFPRFLYTLMGSVGWVYRARKNGLRKRDLYARPLLK